MIHLTPPHPLSGQSANRKNGIRKHQPDPDGRPQHQRSIIHLQAPAQSTCQMQPKCHDLEHSSPLMDDPFGEGVKNSQQECCLCQDNIENKDQTPPKISATAKRVVHSTYRRSSFSISKNGEVSA
eukprot:5213809-Ditylum_brightwellii.AAC.1